MATIPTPHSSWCDESACYTAKDGQPVHLSTGTSFVDYGMATVYLVDRGNGIEVKLAVDGQIVSTEVTLMPELAAELGDALLDHAERALGLGRAGA